MLTKILFNIKCPEKGNYYYLTSVLIPYVMMMREINIYANERAILMIDFVKSHCSNRILKLLAENNILAFVYPSHTSNLFQILDLVVFGPMKQNKILLKIILMTSLQIIF